MVRVSNAKIIPKNINPSNEIQQNFDKKDSLLFGQNNEFTLKSLVHRQESDSLEEKGFLKWILTKINRFRNFVQGKKSNVFFKKNGPNRKTTKLLKFAKKYLNVMKFVKSLKMRSKLRKLDIINERQIGFFQDLAYFSKFDLLIPSKMKLLCLKSKKFEEIFSKNFFYIDSITF